MAVIDPIYNGESGPSVRDKLNELIDTVNSGSTTINVGDAPLFDPNKSGGYEAGSIVSYRNEASPDPEFHEFAIYLALSDIVQGIGPEDSSEWKNEGATVEVAGGSTANGVVQNITRLRELTGMRTGHTVAVQAEGAIYVFDEGSEIGAKPFAPGIGSWVKMYEFSEMGGGHVIQNAAGTDMPTQPALQFGAGFTVTDEEGKTVVEVNENIRDMVPEISAFNSVLLFDKSHKVRKTTMAAPITYSLAESGNKPISFIEDIVLGDGVNEVSIPEAFINTNAGAFDNTKANALIFYYDLDGRVRYTIENLETVIGLTQLATPANFQAVSGGAAQINLSWDASTNATNYTVEVSESGNPDTWSVLTTTASLSAEHTGLTEGATRYYRLRANGDGENYSNSAYTSTVNATTSSGTTLDTPILTMTTVDSITNRATWTNVAGETGFQLQRSADGVTGWDTIYNAVANVLTFDDTNCVPEVQYFYRLKAVGNGTTILDSAYSAVRSIITDAILVPTLSLLPEGTQISITIGNIDTNVDSITLERDNNSDFSTAVAVEEYISPNSSVVDTGLVENVRYYYRCRVSVLGVNSDYFISGSMSNYPGLPVAIHDMSGEDLSNTRITDISGNNRDLVLADDGASPILLSSQFNSEGAIQFPLNCAFKFENLASRNTEGWTIILVTRFISGSLPYGHGFNTGQRNYIANDRTTVGGSGNGISIAQPLNKWTLRALSYKSGLLRSYSYNLEDNVLIQDTDMAITHLDTTDDFGVGNINISNNYRTYSGVTDWQFSIFYENALSRNDLDLLISKLKIDYGV